MLMRPDVHRTSPASARISVLLPQPDGPRSETNSPGSIAKETLSRATILPSSDPNTCSTWSKTTATELMVCGSCYEVIRVEPVKRHLFLERSVFRKKVDQL